MLNIFILISAVVLHLPLGEMSLDAALQEFKELWPAIMAAALVCLPFWLLPLPTGTDAQSHAGAPAWSTRFTCSSTGSPAAIKRKSKQSPQKYRVIIGARLKNEDAGLQREIPAKCRGLQDGGTVAIQKPDGVRLIVGYSTARAVKDAANREKGLR